MSPWRHLPPPRAPPSRRTPPNGGTFAFGGRRVFQPPRCNRGSLPPPRGPSKSQRTQLHLPASSVDALLRRRLTTLNDGAPVVTPASTLRLALPQAVERKRSAARFSKVEGHARPFVVAPATAVQQRRAAPPSRSQRPLAGPSPLSAPFLDPLPTSLDARRPIAANDAPVSSHRPPRCNDGAPRPPHCLQCPAKAQPTSPHPFPTIRDARRPTTANDATRVATLATAARPTSARHPCTLPDTRRPTMTNDAAHVVAPAITRSSRRPPQCHNGALLPPGGLQLPAKARVISHHRHPIFLDPRSLSAVKDRALIVTRATTVQRPRPGPFSRSAGPDVGPRHLPAPSPNPPQLVFARCGERPGPGRHASRRSARTALTSLLAVSNARRWPASPSSALSQSSSTIVRCLH
ncbi:hypothetical protein BKA93DRAFT_747792 [Sparassis latifolia]